MNFKIRTHSKDRRYSEFHFFLLSKGLNAGRPSNIPCPNCFAIVTDNEEDKLYLYWLCYCLWQSKQFERMLTGSVIPFLRLKEASDVILYAMRHCSASTLQARVDSLAKIQLLEDNLSNRLSLVKQWKRRIAGAVVASAHGELEMPSQ